MPGPPLPDHLPTAELSAASDTNDGQPAALPVQFNVVRQGAWLVNYSPSNNPFVVFDGTIRVESQGATRTASGDLYQRPVMIIPGPRNRVSPPPPPVLASAPDPIKGIPIQSRDKYRYYLRVTQILEFSSTADSFELGLQMWKYTGGSGITTTWNNEGDFTATMTWKTPPPNSSYPSPRDYLEGDLKKAGIVVGSLKMGWVSESYRKITLEIDTVNGADRPLGSGDGQSWQTVYGDLGYDLTLDLSETNIPEPSGDGWNDGEAHAAMLAHRDEHNLDSEWRYHMLAVKKLDSTPRGLMYDSGATDSDNVPREGVAIAAQYVFESAPDPAKGIPDWGAVKGSEFSKVRPAYFRAAVHELGHAFNISQHNTINTGFMNTTDAIAKVATAKNPFPSNIIWDFADDDRKRLRHWSDMFVRPGGIAFGSAIRTSLPITPDDEEIKVPELQLEVTALLSEIPLGAPVRIDVKLTNTSDSPMLAPREVGLKSACMTGFVQDPSGRIRSFRPLAHCADSIHTAMLGANESITGSMALLRGAEGALFPSSGVSEILVKANWDVGDGSVQAMVMGRTNVFITGAHEPQHAAAAHKILTTPDAHIVLVVGGDHLEEGVKAIQQAVEDPTLGPHYAAVEAKRLAQPFRGRCAECGKAEKLLSKTDAVQTKREKAKLDKLLQKHGKQHGGKPSEHGTAKGGLKQQHGS
jgi:hypothetical protein